MKFKIIASMILKFVSVINYKLLWFFNLLLNSERTSVNPEQFIHAEFPPIMLGKYKLLGIGISKCSVARCQCCQSPVSLLNPIPYKTKKMGNSLLMIMKILNLFSLQGNIKYQRDMFKLSFKCNRKKLTLFKFFFLLYSYLKSF